MKPQRANKILTGVLSAIIALMFYLHPCTLDDIWYSETWTGDFFKDVASTLKLHYNIDNGRFANVIGTIVLWQPKWFSAIFFAIIFFLMVYLSARLANVVGRPTLYGALVLMILLLLPWAHFMFTVIFAANYLVTSVLLLFVLYLYTRDKIPGTPAALALGFILGAWHEQFGAGMLGAVIATVTIRQRFRPTKIDIALSFGLLAGIIYLASTPGTAVRAEDMEIFAGIKNPTAAAVYGTPYYIFVLIALYCAFFRREVWNTRLFCASFGCATACWAVWRVVCLGLHVTWAMNLISIIGIIWFIANCTKAKLSHSIAAAAVLWIMIFAHMGSCLPWFAKLKSEVDNIDSQAHSRTIVAPLTSSLDAPAYILGKPNFNATTAWASDRLSNVVPPEVVQINAVGDTITGHDIVLEYSSERENEKGVATVTMAGGKTFASDYFLVPYMNTSGKRQLYVRIANLPMHGAKTFSSFILTPQ